MRLSLFAIAALCVSSLSAHADTLKQFVATDINFYADPSTPATTGSLTGGIVVDTTTGTVTSSTLQYNVVGGRTYNFFNVSEQVQRGIGYQVAFTTSGASLELFIPGNLINYAGSQVCYYPSQAACVQPQSGNGSVTVSLSTFFSNTGNITNPYSGSLVAAVTPEPSSFALLGTGLLGVAGVFRRRAA